LSGAYDSENLPPGGHRFSNEGQTEPDAVGAAPRLDACLFQQRFSASAEREGGKFCFVCGSQATYVNWDGDGEPLAFYCDDHVFEARR
jgi:hypothetical protein